VIKQQRIAQEKALAAEKKRKQEAERIAEQQHVNGHNIARGRNQINSNSTGKSIRNSIRLIPVLHDFLLN
jgi:hypothetical protein